MEIVCVVVILKDEKLVLRLSIETFSAVFSSPNTLGSRLVGWGLV